MKSTTSQYNSNLIFKRIAVSKDVYEQLRQLGFTGESFNDVIKRIIAESKSTRKGVKAN